MKQIPKDKFVKLIRITNNDPVDVYDLEVEQDHEFYANGFLVHNCLGNYHPHGDKACLRGDTIVPLLFEGATTIKKLVDSEAGPKSVFAYNPIEKKLVVTTAHSWRATKIVTELVKVHLSSGEYITCTADHEILTNFGWCEAGNLNNGDSCVGGTVRYQDIKMNDGNFYHLENFLGNYHAHSSLSYKKSITDKGNAWYDNTVVFVEHLVLEEPEYVYDFTSSSHENMIVFTSDGLKTKNFSVVHNCYDAIVNAAVNQNIPMVHGEGNFGTMTEGPAAMRYCFTEDAKVMVMQEDLMVKVSFKELAISHGVYQKVGEAKAAPMIVVTKDGFAAPSHVVCSGKQKTVEVFAESGDSVCCTPNEPFFVFCTTTNSYSWVDADNLEPGNLLVRAKYDEEKEISYSVTPVTKVEAREKEYVYDLCVPDGHSFTANGFVVHNTNLKLSKYSDLVFFDKFYMPTVEYVPNYDGSRKEPLVLPALLPNAVLNGNFGIAPGVNTRSPMFTLKSVAKVIQKTLDNGGVCTPEMCIGLEFTTATGGTAVRTKANKSEFLEFFKTGKGRVTFTSTSSEVKNNSIRFDRFAPISDMEKVMSKIEAIKGVQSTRDDSDEKDPFKTAFVINFVKTQKGAALDSVIKQVNAVMTSNYTFDIKVTDRFIKENGQAAASLRATTIPKMIEEWLAYRIKIEIGACQYWTKEAEKRIAYLELMRIAIANIDTIIKHIKNKKLDDVKLIKAIGKDLKISDEQVNLILARNLRQLRHLEDQKLLATIKELQKEIKGYSLRIKKPTDFISTNICEIVKKLK